MRNLFLLSLAAAICGLSLPEAINEAQAQTQPQTQPSQRPNPAVTRPYSSANPNRDGKVREAEFNSQPLPRPISLPGLPSFTGTQYYINGLTYPNAKGGAGYMMIYNCENTAEQIKEWWDSALKSHRWSVNFTDKKSIKAKDKDGNTCIINVQAPVTTTKEKSKNVRAAYQIYYQQLVK